MIKRGDIYFVQDTRTQIGSEQKGDRPAVIVSNNTNNKFSEIYEVVYMTTQPKTELPTHFITYSALKPSTVLCEQIYSVHKDRITEWIGSLTPEEIKSLDECLSVSVGIEPAQSSQTPINEELQQAKTQAKEALEAKQIAEKRADTYKEMYEFLLNKQLNM